MKEASLLGRELVSWVSGVQGFTPTSADPEQPYLPCTCHLSPKARKLCSPSLLCLREGRAAHRAWVAGPEIQPGGSLCFHGSSLFHGSPPLSEEQCPVTAGLNGRL